MSNRKASFNAIAALLAKLSDDQQLALLDRPDEFVEFAAAQAAKIVQDTYFVPIADKDVPQKIAESVWKWRKLASDLGYTGPVCWRVRAGFTLKSHAPQAGPCYEKFGYLQDWQLQNDEATQSCVVFWIPRLVKDSVSKTVEEQMVLAKQVRTTYDLPAHHLTSFGSAALNSGAVLAHYKRTGERTPLNGLYVRTDTLHVDGSRLNVGYFDETGLGCDVWRDGERYGYLGFFPWGMEMGV